MIATKVGRRGQITLPRSVRQWLQIDQGDRVVFIRRGDEVLIQPLTETLLDLRGSVSVDHPQDFDLIRQHIKDERGRRNAS